MTPEAINDLVRERYSFFALTNSTYTVLRNQLMGLDK